MALINVFRVGVSRDDAPELFLESREDRVQQAVKTSEDSDELLEDLKWVVVCVAAYDCAQKCVFKLQ